MLALATAEQFAVFGAKGIWAVLVMLALGSVTFVTVVRAGLVPLFRAIARGVEAIEVILGDGSTERPGLAARLDSADQEREDQGDAIETIRTTLSGAALLNGKGERLIRDMSELKDVAATLAAGQVELHATLGQHITDESTRNAAIWKTILDDKSHPAL